MLTNNLVFESYIFCIGMIAGSIADEQWSFLQNKKNQRCSESSFDVLRRLIFIKRTLYFSLSLEILRRNIYEIQPIDALQSLIGSFITRS